MLLSDIELATSLQYCLCLCTQDVDATATVSAWTVLHGDRSSRHVKRHVNANLAHTHPQRLYGTATQLPTSTRRTAQALCCTAGPRPRTGATQVQVLLQYCTCTLHAWEDRCNVFSVLRLVNATSSMKLRVHGHGLTVDSHLQRLGECHSGCWDVIFASCRHDKTILCLCHVNGYTSALFLIYVKRLFWRNFFEVKVFIAKFLFGSWVYMGISGNKSLEYWVTYLLSPKLHKTPLIIH
jgi:hypothetical protein